MSFEHSQIFVEINFFFQFVLILISPTLESSSTRCVANIGNSTFFFSFFVTRFLSSNLIHLSSLPEDIAVQFDSQFFLPSRRSQAMQERICERSTSVVGINRWNLWLVVTWGELMSTTIEPQSHKIKFRASK